MLPPWPMKAMVVDHDPENDAMMVMVSSGQMPTFVVKRLYHGAADSHRFNKTPLPARGTWGLIVAPGGDPRNVIWLGAFHPNLADSIPNTQADPFSDYQAYFSGHWSYIDGLSGYVSNQFADGSYFVASSGTSLQGVFRHIVDDQQNRKQIAYSFDERNPNPQPTFSYTFMQSGTGFSHALNSSGSLAVLIPNGQSTTFTQSGTNTTWQIDASGNILFNAGPSFKISDNNGNSIVSSESGIVITDNNGNSITMNSGGIVQQVKHGKLIKNTAGGTLIQVQLTTEAPSSVLEADE